MGVLQYKIAKEHLYIFLTSILFVDEALCKKLSVENTLDF
jgi:hypothetical protein